MAEAVNDIRKHLYVVCETCYEEMNCHPISEMRWSRVVPGSEAEPIPVCHECWENTDEVPCEWKELEPCELP